jgi:protein-tyrosine kinase
MSAVDRTDHARPVAPTRIEEWRIGFILMRAGRLKKEDVVRIIARQRETGQRFGAAAVDLGLLGQNDIRFALAQQFDYPYATAGDSKFSQKLIAAYEPHSATAESFRALRSELMIRWFEPDQAMRESLAIVGPDRGSGRSWLAANLAITFAQLGKNTVLIDADLRHSAQHELFGLASQPGLSEILCGRAVPMAVLERNKVMPNLAIVPAGTTPPNPQEVLARTEFVELMDSLRKVADVIIVDTPADNEAKDCQIIAKCTRAAMLIAKRKRSRTKEISRCAAGLHATGTKLLMSVLVD